MTDVNSMTPADFCNKKKKNSPSNVQVDPNDNADYAIIKCIGRLVIDILMKCWALSTAAILAVLLVYCMYGGWLAFCLLSFATAGVVYHAGDWILFHPEQPPHSRLYVPSPHAFGMPFENLFLRTKDGVQINAVLIKQHTLDAMAKATTVVFLHGNAGNIGHRLVNAKGLFYKSGCNVLLVEYRGYGRSEGTPSEEGLYLDVQAAVDFLISRKDIDVNKIVLFGRSLGGAVAINLASNPHYVSSVMALIVENTFTSIPDMAYMFINSRFLKMLPYCFYKNKFMSKLKIRHARVPTLFISGLADSLIPPRMMQELYTFSGSTMKGLVTFESGTHNETWQCDGYYQALNSFLNKVTDVRSRSVPLAADEFCVQIPANIA